MQKNAEQLKAERKARLDKALRYEKCDDRIPVVIMGHVPISKIADPDICPADALERPEYFVDKGMEALNELYDVDAVHGFTGAMSKTKGLSWMSNVKLPGVELKRTEMMQIIEIPQMEYSDYDRILTRGWKEFQADYIENKLGLKPKDFEFGRYIRKYAEQKLAENGFLEWSGAGTPMPFDWMTAMRGMTTFFRDLKKEPKMIKDVIFRIYEDTLPDFKEGIKKLTAYSAMVQPAVRSNCDFVSRKIFEEYTWPLVENYTNVVLEAGLTPFFHYDARWDDFLDFFTVLPKNKCIFDTDGMTDIHLVKKHLGGIMAITGNTPASLMTLGTPDDVYNFVKNQISELGEEGYIITSSCGIPINAPAGNVKAMVAAAR